MADIDLATILADGEYLRRAGDDLIGDVPTIGGTLPFIDPRDHGAVGDGVADDTAAVAAAVTEAVTAGGGNILVPAGFTFSSGPVTVAAAVTVRFFGGGTLKLRTLTGAAGFVGVTVAGGELVLDGVTVDGNAATLSSNFSALAYAWYGAHIRVSGCTVRNVAKGCGVLTDVDALMTVVDSHIHTVAYTGVMVRGEGAAIVRGNTVHDTGSNAVMVRPSSTPAGDAAFTSDGCTIAGNVIYNVRDDFAGTGNHGNGINLWRPQGVTVSGNVIRDTAWSFIRCGGGVKDVSIVGNTGRHNLDDPGIFVEFGASYLTVSSNTLRDCAESGIALTNVEDGAVGIQCCNNVITGVGRIGASHGVILATGLCANNYLDGLGVANAVAAVRVGTPPTISAYDFRALVADNQIAGFKYAVAFGISSTAATKYTSVTDNQITRMDGNWVGPIGATGGSNSDAGTGDLIDAASARAIYMDGNNWDVPTVQTPKPMADGSRLKINGTLNTCVAGAWTTERPRVTRYKSANQQINNSIVLTDDTHLQFPIAASETWVGTFVLFTNGNAAADMVIDVNAPAGATIQLSTHAQRAADAIVEATSGTSVIVGTATTASRHVFGAFSVVNSTTAGTVKLRWAQSVATVANLTVAIGSHLSAERIVP